MMKLLTGSARELITPPMGIPIGGNARSLNYATHVIDDLFVRALYVESGDIGVCIISLELLGLAEQDARRLREQVASAVELTAEQVMIACTHTHSAPDTMRLFCATKEKSLRDQALVKPWMSELFARVETAARRAKAAAAPSRMTLQQIDNSKLPRNRRLRLNTGETVMNWTLPTSETVVAALGPIDPAVTLAAFYHEDNALAGAIVHYTLHPAILAGLNLGISGDYCGLAMGTLEREFAPADKAAFLFLNGALGNINHIDYQNPAPRDESEVNCFATSLADSVRSMLSRDLSDLGGDYNAILAVRARAEDLLFQIREISVAQISDARVLLARKTDGVMAAADGVPPEMEAMRTLRLHEVKTTGACEGEFTTLRNGQVVVPVQLIRIGKLSLAAVPAEMFVEHGLAFKQQCANPFALMVCPANGYIGYVPIPEAFEQGGYEPGLGPGFLDPGAGEIILKTFMEFDRDNGREQK